MHVVRFIGAMIAIVITLGISYLFNIAFIEAIAMCGFILAVDNLMVKYIAKIYLKAMMEATPEDKDKE